MTRGALRAAACCEAVYLLVLTLSVPFGAVLSVSAVNVYARGPWFFVYVILYLAMSTLRTADRFQNRTMELHGMDGVLVVFDVDSFKQINDRYGHLQGDVCLAEIADCIKKAYARCGYCYRIGGDEFCVLLRDAADEARCAAALQSLLAERRKEITLLPTLSLGSAVFSGEDMVTVKDRADRALYCAKNELKARAAAAMPAGGSGEKGLNGSFGGKNARTLVCSRPAMPLLQPRKWKKSWLPIFCFHKIGQTPICFIYPASPQTHPQTLLPYKRLRVFLSQFSKNSAYQNSIFAVCSLRMLLLH